LRGIKKNLSAVACRGCNFETSSSQGATRRLDALGSGAIAFGHSPRDRDAEVVGFWCESSGDGKE